MGVDTKEDKSRIKVTEMTFSRAVKESATEDRLRNDDFRGELNIFPIHSRLQECKNK